jgi:hypothetical protein
MKYIGSLGNIFENLYSKLENLEEMDKFVNMLPIKTEARVYKLLNRSIMSSKIETITKKSSKEKPITDRFNVEIYLKN